MRCYLVLFTLIVCPLSFGQTFYESPFVVNNQSFRFTVPPGFEEFSEYKILVGQDPNASVYSTNSLLAAMGPFGGLGGMLAFSTSVSDSNDILDKSFFEFFAILTDTSEIQFEQFVTSSGDTFMVAQEIEPTFIPDLQYSIAFLTFDTVKVTVMLTDSKSSKREFLDQSFFEAILKSFNRYETDRKSTFIRERELHVREHHHAH